MTAMATLSVLLLPAKHGMDLWRKRRLNGAFVEAQVALGERMYAAGIDDGEMGRKLAPQTSGCSGPKQAEARPRR